MEQGAHQLLRNHGFYYGAGHNQHVFKILESLKEKAVSLIVEDDRTHSLLKDLVNSAKLKVLFRNQYPQYDVFSLGEDDMKTIERLPDKEALIYSNE